MYRKHSIGVVVPAHNEALLIAQTVNTMPDFVDKIIVVDDKSNDRTAAIVDALCKENDKVVLICHPDNRGVGGAISSGYVWCRDNGIDIAVVMAGDGQMDPNDLPSLLDPVVEDRADYAKGNRLFTGEAWSKIPKVRYLGNSALSLLTKIASGYWQVADSQTGYTAINRKALEWLPIEDIYPRYGMPNDLLVTLNIYNMRVIDIPVKPVYNIGEKSGINIKRVLFSLSFLVLRLFAKRMLQKYVIRDFHPLVFFYTIGTLLFLLDVPLIIRLFAVWFTDGAVPQMTALAVLFCTVAGLQFVLFAMLFDMEANKHLAGEESSHDTDHRP